MDVALWLTGSGTEMESVNFDKANYEHQSAILVRWIVKATVQKNVKVNLNMLESASYKK